MLSIKDLLYGGFVPAVVAFVLWWVARLVLKEQAAARYAPSLALVSGFCVAYFLLTLGPWVPKVAANWLPYVVAATVIVGPVVHASGVSWFERFLMYSLFAVVAAWLLVSTRTNLEPSRLVHMLCWGPALVLTASLLDGVLERVRGPLMSGMLAFVSVCAAAILGLSASLSYAQMAGAATAALAGITVVMCWSRNATLKGMSLSVSTLLCGFMLIGKIGSRADVPLASYVIIPLAPLLMWCAIRGPLSNGTGFVGGLKKVALPVIACLVAVGLAVMADLAAHAE